jgi:hypothetical protein
MNLNTISLPWYARPTNKQTKEKKSDNMTLGYTYVIYGSIENATRV